MRLRRMPSAMRFLLSNRQCQRAVHVERHGRSASPRCDAYDSHAVPAEVRSPRVEPRMEKRDLLARLRVLHEQASALAQGAETQASARFSKLVFPPTIAGRTWS